MQSAKTYNDIEGVVLAGGLNRRYNGEVKAKLPVNGRPMIDRTLDILGSLFSDITIVANDQDAFREYADFHIVGDIFQQIGPLGGIHAALSNCRSKSVFVVASDMPGISGTFIRSMCERFQESNCEALIPFRGDFREPLHAIYSKSILGRLTDYIRSGSDYKIMSFLTRVNFEKFEAGSEDFFININRPSEMEEYLSGSKKNHKIE